MVPEKKYYPFLSLLLFPISLAICTLITSCDRDKSTSHTRVRDGEARNTGTPGYVNLVVNYVNPPGSNTRKSTAVVSIDRITAYVYEKDDTLVIEKPLQRIADRGVAIISVTPGNDLTLDLVAYDAETVRFMGRNADVDVIAGDTTEVVVDLHSTFLELSIFRLDSTAAYSLNWNPVPLLNSYVLHESIESTFATPDTIGPLTESSINLSRPQVGTYYYRVRAITTYGNGPWSVSKAVSSGSLASVIVLSPIHKDMCPVFRTS